jgi:hypothetical protein
VKELVSNKFIEGLKNGSYIKQDKLEKDLKTWAPIMGKKVPKTFLELPLIKEQLLAILPEISLSDFKNIYISLKKYDLSYLNTLKKILIKRQKKA